MTASHGLPSCATTPSLSEVLVVRLVQTSLAFRRASSNGDGKRRIDQVLSLPSKLTAQVSRSRWREQSRDQLLHAFEIDGFS